MSDNITAVSMKIIKEELNQSFVMKLHGYWCGVHPKICGYQLHTFLEHKILRQTVFLETSVRLLSGN